MHFQEFLVTHAGQAGLSSVLTEYILVVTFFSFFGMTIFSLATKGSVSPSTALVSGAGLVPAVQP